MAIRFGRNRFPDHLVGTDEHDRLYGYSDTEGRWTDTGGDVLEGGAGNDFLAGGWGRDTLRGGRDNDHLDGGMGADVLDGGWGIDTAEYYFSTSAVYLNLLEGQGYAGEAEGDTFISIENVIGSGWDDVIVGDNRGNELNGWHGHDTLLGLDGFDYLYGGDGSDLLYGGDDVDYLYGGRHDDRLWGGAGGDRLRGEHGADRFIYNDVSDSRPSISPWEYDKILDFGIYDVLDLSGIDANTTAGAAGNQAFTWIEGSEFTGAGQLRMEAGSGWFVYGETTGDGVADFLVWINIGPFGAGDVIL